MKRCKDCKYKRLYVSQAPCRDCTGFDKYTPKSFAGWLWIIALLLLTLALLLGGCGVEAKYTDEFGREFYYKRTGPQQIGEVLLELSDGSTFLMDGQKSEMPPVKITLPNGIIIESGKVEP